MTKYFTQLKSYLGSHGRHTVVLSVFSCFLTVFNYITNMCPLSKSSLGYVGQPFWHWYLLRLLMDKRCFFMT